jgi:hypothetical protein
VRWIGAALSALIFATDCGGGSSNQAAKPDPSSPSFENGYHYGYLTGVGIPDGSDLTTLEQEGACDSALPTNGYNPDPTTPLPNPVNVKQWNLGCLAGFKAQLGQGPNYGPAPSD